MSLLYTIIQTHRYIIVWWFTTHILHWQPILRRSSVMSLSLFRNMNLQSQFLTEGIDLCLSGLQKGRAHGMKVVGKTPTAILLARVRVIHPYTCILHVHTHRHTHIPASHVLPHSHHVLAVRTAHPHWGMQPEGRGGDTTIN